MYCNLVNNENSGVDAAKWAVLREEQRATEVVMGFFEDSRISWPAPFKEPFKKKSPFILFLFLYFLFFLFVMSFFVSRGLTHPDVVTSANRRVGGFRVF